MTKERLETLSDGVIVIIMTIMVFEIKLPDFSLSFQAFIPTIQHIGVYAMSFLVLSVMWINHHQIFKGSTQLSPAVVWLNFLLLFFMSLIPLPTKALGQHLYSVPNHVFYGVILTCNSVCYSLLQYQVNKKAKSLPSKVRQSINKKNVFSTCLYALSIPFSFVSVYFSLVIFILIPAMYFLPSDRTTASQ